MTFTDLANTATQAQEAWTRATESLTGGLQRVLGQLPDIGLAGLDPNGAIDRYFDFAAQLLEINRQYAKTLAGASLTVGQAVREQTNSVTEVVRNQAGATVEATRDQVEKMQRAERDQAKKLDEAVRDGAADTYRDWTKAELSDELARRGLPRTGNVEQLRERLINADLNVR